MKTRFSVVVATIVCFVAQSFPLTVEAQSGVPSQGIFEQSLRPVPRALQGGHQGLPTAGTISRPDTGAAFSVPSASGPNESDVERSTAKKKPTVTVTASSHRSAATAPSDSAPKPSISVQTIQFEFSSAKLKPESIETLRNLGDALNQGLSDQKLFLIEGHTDAAGARAYNLELSRLRAEAVKDFLVNTMGVSPSRLTALGKGSADPINSRNPYAAENRRVVVINNDAG
jgi:outer membrane protein OmpA-like peptidoglycan-associated protein